MIKCPICGSRNIRCVLTPSLNTAHTGDYSCNQCGLIWNNSSATLTSEYPTTIKLPVPTTAEKLLWLVENFVVRVHHYFDGEHRLVVSKIRKDCGDVVVLKSFMEKSLDDSITAAYEWAKEEK